MVQEKISLAIIHIEEALETIAVAATKCSERSQSPPPPLPFTYAERTNSDEQLEQTTSHSGTQPRE